VILIRATTLTERTAGLADELARASGLQVGFLLDGRHPVNVETTRPIVSLTEAACTAHGLLCPPDFAWRCGDYGLYLARSQFPEVSHFWLIEYDVRLAGGPAEDFFAAFLRTHEVDFLAAHLRPAEADWDWFAHASGRGVRPHRCLFTVVRLSARALDFLLEGRRRQGQMRQRRKVWPNDEAFVATSLANADFVCRDFNSFGHVFYTPQTNSTTGRFDGDNFHPPPEGVRIYHPVLFGEAFRRGNLSAQSNATTWLSRAKAKIRRSLNLVTPW
jgi:hypothetical protein